MLCFISLNFIKIVVNQVETEDLAVAICPNQITLGGGGTDYIRH